MTGFRHRLWRRAIGPVACALALAGCLSPNVHKAGTTAAGQPKRAAAEPGRIEPATPRPGHAVPIPKAGYPSIRNSFTPYSDWEAPWDWTYAPSLEAHRDGQKSLERMEGRLRDLHGRKPRPTEEATHERE